MEGMKAKSAGKFTYRQIYEYINDGKYPEIIREMHATNSLVGKGPSFSRCRRCISITLVACFYVNARQAIGPLPAILAKPIGDLRHRRAIIYYDTNLHPFLAYERRPLQRLA